uniref:Uncharacterized protein n=1 Tax=Neogobius melanostomus TaxID=47308 RepID=A0A8C6WUL2_9GOBI
MLWSQVVRAGEGPLTQQTLVWLLSCVFAIVTGQFVRTCKLPAAALPGAMTLQMAKPNTSGGLWNCAHPITYSQETQELLKLLMKESHLANVQKRQIRECLNNGAPLHLACVSMPSSPPPPQSKPSQSTSHGPASKLQKRRTIEQCKAGDSYVRERFRPGPIRDLEKEKQRFQRILEMGKDKGEVTINQRPSKKPPQQKERFDEIMEEIEERRQFLDDMASVGQEHEYANIINAEISQRIRELKMLDKSRTQTLEKGTLEQKRDKTEEI